MSFLPYLQFSKVFHCGLILVESLEAGNGHNRVRRVATMKEFIRKYEDRIHGALSCFDRMLFRGYLPIMSGWAMAGFLDRLHQDFSSLKPFLLENSERVKNHAIALAQKHGQPFRYLASNIKKEEAARELARVTESSTVWCVFSRFLNHAAPFRSCSRKNARISVLSLNPHGGSVCTCTSTSWIVTSA